MTNNFNQMQNSFAQFQQMIQGFQNPTSFLQAFVMKNPEYQGLIDILNQNNGNEQQAFYDLAQRKGVDPNQIIQQINQMAQQMGQMMRR